MGRTAHIPPGFHDGSRCLSWDWMSWSTGRGIIQLRELGRPPIWRPSPCTEKRTGDARAEGQPYRPVCGNLEMKDG